MVQLVLYWQCHLSNLNPNKKILLITPDIAKYKINSQAESSGGAASVAMIISNNPRILEIEQHHGIYTEDNMDFWRPNYMDTPIVNGRLSCNLYIRFLLNSFISYSNKSNISLNDIDYFLSRIST